MENTPNTFENLPSGLRDALAEQPVLSRRLQDTEEYDSAQNEGFHPIGGDVLSASEMYALYAAFLEKMQAARIQSEEEIIR